MAEAKIRDYERDEVVGRVTEDGIEPDDSLFADVVGESFDDGKVEVVYPGDEAGEYRTITVRPGERGYVREVVDELPSPFDIDDTEKLSDLEIYEPDEVDKGVQVINLDKRKVYIDDPSEAPPDANVQEGERGGLYYETEQGEERPDDTDGESRISELIENTEVREWPEEHTIYSVSDVKQIFGELSGRGDPDVMATTLENIQAIEDRVKQSAHRKDDQVTQFRPDADFEVYAHEFGHAVLSTHGLTVPDAGNMFAHFYAQQVPTFEEGQTMPEVAENLLEMRRERRGEVEEGLQQKLDEIQKEYEGVELNREDAHIHLDRDAMPFDDPNNVPEELDRLSTELNQAWERMLDAEEAERDNYIIGKAYSATNPHETMSMTHEMLQGDAAIPKAIENLYIRHPGLLDAYLDVFEPADVQKEMINQVYDYFGGNEYFDNLPFPEAANES